MMELKRIADPQISPDGKWVAFTVQTVDVAANKKPSQIWIVPLTGGAPRQITHDGETNQRPRWSPDSKRIAYHLRPRRLLADLADGRRRRRTPSRSPIFPPKPTACCSRPTARTCSSPATSTRSAAPTTPATRRTWTPTRPARSRRAIYTELLYRHWTAWQAKRRSHLLVVPAAGGAPRDLTPGTRDVPPFSLGGPDDYDISPDGQEVCYSMNADPVPATSTNSDLYAVSIKGGEPRKITNTPGARCQPAIFARRQVHRLARAVPRRI